MKYSYSKNLKMNLVTAENKVREVLMEVGFGVLTEINIKEAFKSKLNIDFKNYKILGACNPELANSAIEIEELIGILMPCNILIIDNLDETTKIVFPIAKSLLDITGNSQIDKLSIKVDELLKTAFDNIN